MRGIRRLLAAAVVAMATGGAAVGADADLKVVATIKPIHSLLTRLMEGVGTPVLLVEGSASPHAFALKPSGVRAINAADVFVRVSEVVEPFTRRIVRTLPEDVTVVTLMEAPGVRRLERRDGGTFAVRGGAGDAHAEGGNHDNEDGHIWLDPENAKAIVAYLADVLAARAPAHAAKLKANAARLNADIDALESEIAAEMAPIKTKPFIVFHDAYQYFENRFDLNAVGAITTSPAVQPSAKRLSELRGKIRTRGAVCVFSEPLFKPNLVAAVTEGTNVRSGTLDPSGATLPPGADLYFALMRNLARNLKSCLGRPS